MSAQSDRFDRLFEDIGSMKASIDSFRHDHRELADGIGDMRKKLDSIDRRTTSLESDMMAAKPFIEKARQWEQRGIGAGMVLAAIGAVFGGAAVAMRDRILSSIGWT